jgi:hypothetical protein
MPATSPAMPQIASEGPPPERHADRVVNDMIRWLAVETARSREAVVHVLAHSADGNPKAQGRLADRIRAAGNGVITQVGLESGKRGRYRLAYCYWAVWDPDRDCAVVGRDELSAGKLWLSYFLCQTTSKGGGKYSDVAAPALLVSHHALSRLAQRCGARTPLDLLGGMFSMWNAVGPRILDAPSTPWRVEIEGGATILVEAHARLEKTPVVVTVLDKDMAR